MAIVNLTYYPCADHVKNLAKFDTVLGSLVAQFPTTPVIDPAHACYGFGNNVYPVYPWSIFFTPTQSLNLKGSGAFDARVYNLFPQKNDLVVNFVATLTTAKIVISGVTPAPGTFSYEYAIVHEVDPSNNVGWQNSPIFDNLPGGDYMVFVRQKAGSGGDIFHNAFKFVHVNGHLAGNASETDVSSTGGTDGSITVTVTEGSGDYTVTIGADVRHVNADPFQAVYSGLAANAYSIHIVDNITGEDVTLSITVNSPNIPIPQGTFFFVPPMQSLQFVHEADSTDPDYLQTMDNVRFCKRVETSPIWMKLNYYQKLCLRDKVTIQWQSDYNDHSVTILNYRTNAVVDSLLFSLKVQNIGITELFNILLADNLTPAQTRVYFDGDSSFPVPVAVGDTFNVTANGEGMDGAYTVQAIGFDPVRNQQYLVISGTYMGVGATSTAVGQFYTTLAPFNIFEALVDFSLYPEDLYYINITALGGTVNSTPALSEPISLKAKHPKTNLLEFSNIDNAFDINYTTGITHRVRVESNDFKRLPAAIINTLRNTTGESKMLRFLPQRKFLFETYGLPPYLHEKLAIVFGMDYKALQGVQVKTEEVYGNAKYVETFDLSDSSINAEVDWFKTYNTHNLNPSNSSGIAFRYFERYFDKFFE